METIHAFSQHPSTASNSLRFAIAKDRQIAKAEAERVGPAVYTDGSRRNGLVGIAVAWEMRHMPAYTLQELAQHYKIRTDWTQVWETIDYQTNTNEYAAELTAILRALQILKAQPRGFTNQITILTDCLAAIQSIRKPRYQSGQYLLQQIWQIARQLYNQGLTVTLQWVPAHEGIKGNEIAHQCARRATSKKEIPVENRGPQLKSRALQASREWTKEERIKLFDKLQVGKFTRTMDKALPNEHMTKVYNSLSREDAGILSRLRTGHAPLNDTLARIGVEESAACTCGARIESVFHFLFHCPKWRDEQSNLQKTMAEVDRWADLAYALGGWSGRKDRGTDRFVDGPRERWKPNMKVLKAVIQYVKATGRFQPRAVMSEETEGVEATEEILEDGWVVVGERDEQAGGSL
jgi:ribonuclease HI